MGKRFKWVESGLDQFIAAFAQEFGEYRRPEKEGKIFSSAHLASVAQVIEKIIGLRFQPYLRRKTIREWVGLRVAVKKVIQDDDLCLCRNSHPGKSVIRKRQTGEHRG